MTVNLKDFDFGAIDSGLIETERKKASAFQTLGQKLPLGLTGATIGSVGDIVSNGVGEGEAKVASGTNNNVVMGANKFVSVVVQNEEAWAYSSAIASAIVDQQPSAHAKTFDAYVLGLRTPPVAFANFAQVSGAAVNDIGTGDAASVDFDDAVSSVKDGIVNGIVITSSMLAYLKRQRNTANGTRIFDITGGIDNGTIEGIPFATVASPTKLAIAGDFTKYYWGTVAEDAAIANKVKDAGTITDDASHVHNLTSENKIALFNELFQGSAVVDLTAFTKLVPTAGS